jgi:restriction system protein
MKPLDAIETVLKESAAPLHYEAITKQILEKGRWQPNVQAPVVQQVRGSLGAHEQGLIITTSDFAKGAIEEANRADATPVALMNGEQLVKLLVENDIGIRRTPADLIELGEGEDEV